VHRPFFTLVLLGLLGTAPAAGAHDGPPFPLLEEHRAGPYVISIWSDPDIGSGEVFVLLRAHDGRTLSADTRVRVGIRPLSGRAPETQHRAELQARGSSLRYFAAVTFDRGERFRVRALVEGARGPAEASAEVLATPDAEVGLFGLLIALFPFAGVAFLWGRAALERRAASR
jgi:hypothetical protein